MIDFSTLQGLTIPEGVVTQIEDEAGNVIWVSGGGKVILEVEKITSDTYAAETTYTAEEFILLNIFPKTNGTVSVTYGGLTKTITDTSGAEWPNAQQVFFGTFNGVSDSVQTPASGRLTIEGDYVQVATGSYYTAKSTSLNFRGVTAIHSLAGVSSLYLSAFANCEKISSVRIPGSVKNISIAAFANCKNLKNVILSEGVKSIGLGAFSMCSLLSIKIPASVTEIGSNPFYNSNPNNFITVDEGNLHFKIDNNCLVEIATARLVTGFNDSVISPYIKQIAGFAFGYCTFTSIDIPNSVTSIDGSAFSYCSSLASITIPASVTDMGGSIFGHCAALREVVVLATTPPTASLDTPNWFNGCTLSSITVPKGCGEAYKTAKGWSQYADYIVEAS